MEAWFFVAGFIFALGVFLRLGGQGTAKETGIVLMAVGAISLLILLFP